MYIYLNGEFIRQEDARISPFDHGYLYGVGLFETFRTYDGHPFLLDDHLMRLQNGLNNLKINLQLKGEEVKGIINHLLTLNELRDAYIRLNVSAGEGEIGLPSGDYMKPNVLLFMKPIPAFPREKEAVILKTPRNTPEGEYRLKSHHFLNNINAKREIGNNPILEGIFLTKEGFLAEGITSNLFWIKKNIIYTPALETGILNGITRQFILKIAEKLSLETVEGLFYQKDLEGCDEAFITNSIQEIIPLTKINHVNLPGKGCPLTTVLMENYKSFIGQA